MTTTTDTFRGRLEEQTDGTIIVSVPDTSYRLHLVAPDTLDARPGQRLTGVITAQAKRVDVVGTGGRYIEPVHGRPRRVQGRVVANDTATNTITVRCGPTMKVTLMPSQKAADFPEGAFVSFDVERGAAFVSA